MKYPHPRKKRLKFLLALFCILGAALAMYSFSAERAPLLFGSPKSNRQIGDKIDEFDGVAVYYNGQIKNVSGRNTAPDGYNLGQQYQCVEFVKRYYYESKGHKMPNPWGNAKDFFKPDLADGAMNEDRGLRQYTNGSKNRPERGDLVVMNGIGYGHVGIISAVENKHVEMIQQNPGPDEPSRIRIAMSIEDGSAEKRWKLENKRILGWLRKE